MMPVILKLAPNVINVRSPELALIVRLVTTSPAPRSVGGRRLHRYGQDQGTERSEPDHAAQPAAWPVAHTGRIDTVSGGVRARRRLMTSCPDMLRYGLPPAEMGLVTHEKNRRRSGVAWTPQDDSGGGLAGRHHRRRPAPYSRRRRSSFGSVGLSAGRWQVRERAWSPQQSD